MCKSCLYNIGEIDHWGRFHQPIAVKRKYADSKSLAQSVAPTNCGNFTRKKQLGQTLPKQKKLEVKPNFYTLLYIMYSRKIFDEIDPSLHYSKFLTHSVNASF